MFIFKKLASSLTRVTAGDILFSNNTCINIDYVVSIAALERATLFNILLYSHIDCSV